MPVAKMNPEIAHAVSSNSCLMCALRLRTFWPTPRPPSITERGVSYALPGAPICICIVHHAPRHQHDQQYRSAEHKQAIMNFHADDGTQFHRNNQNCYNHHIKHRPAAVFVHQVQIPIEFMALLHLPAHEHKKHTYFKHGQNYAESGDNQKQQKLPVVKQLQHTRQYRKRGCNQYKLGDGHHRCDKPYHQKDGCAE